MRAWRWQPARPQARPRAKVEAKRERGRLSRRACTTARASRPSHSRAMGGDGLNLVQGNFKDFRALAAQGPAPQPAAVVVVVDANHLIHPIFRSQGHTGPLVEFWGWSRTGKRSHAAVLVNDMAAWDGGLGEGEAWPRSINPGHRRNLEGFALIPMGPRVRGCPQALPSRRWTGGSGFEP